MDKGLLNGAEYYYANNSDHVPAGLWGVEDAALYKKNLSVYTDNLENTEVIDRYLKEVFTVINVLKTRLFNKELMEMDIKRACYKAGTLDLKSYMLYLANKEKTMSGGTDKYWNVSALERLIEKEKDIDFRKAGEERDIIIDIMGKMLPKKDLRELVDKTMGLKDDRVTREDYYHYLLGVADRMGLNMGKYPELMKYSRYLAAYGAIDRALVAKELGDMELDIKGLLFENGKQKELDIISRHFSIVRDMFSIKTTRSDYDYYIKNKEIFDLDAHIGFIRRESLALGLASGLSEDIGRLQPLFDNMVRFFEYSFARDNAFVSNLRTDGVSVLITGGFHTDNLLAILKQNNISYVSVMPEFISAKGYTSPYLALLSGKESSEVEALGSEVNAIALWSDYCVNAGNILPGGEARGAQALG
jgi:hypothetical protein